MNSDMQPRRTLVRLFGQLQHVRSPRERRLLLDSIEPIIEVLKEDVRTLLTTKPPIELSEVAARIVDRCGGATLSIKRIAKEIGCAPSGGHFNEAIRELKAKKLAVRVKKGLYKISKPAVVVRQVQKNEPESISHTQPNSKPH